MNKQIIIDAINALEEMGYDEMQLRKACKMVFPSFKLTKDTSYGLYNRSGYQHNYFEIYNKNGDRFAVRFVEYDCFHDKNSDCCCF